MRALEAQRALLRQGHTPFEDMLWSPRVAFRVVPPWVLMRSSSEASRCVEPNADALGLGSYVRFANARCRGSYVRVSVLW